MPCTPLLLATLFRKLLLLAPFSVNPCWLFPVAVFPLKKFFSDRLFRSGVKKLRFTTKPKKFPVDVTSFTSEWSTPSKLTPLPKFVIVPSPWISTWLTHTARMPDGPSEPPEGPVMVWPFRLSLTWLAVIDMQVTELVRLATRSY